MQLSFLDRTPNRSSFNILTVCTGNICRSPLGESLLRRELSRLPVVISSAGTHALVGKPMYESNQEIARELGIGDASEHRAKQLSVDMLEQSDLVLAMDRGHRRQIVEMLPRASRYTFTLREFARLADQVSNEDLALRSGRSAVELLRDTLELVAQLRGTLPLLDDPLQEDVIDPYGQKQEMFKISAEQLIPAVMTSSYLLNDAVGEI